VTESPTVNKWIAAAVKSKVEALIGLVEDKFSPVPPEVTAKIEATTALDVLHNWVITAATVDTLEKFRQAAGV
jgi:hypothetical protein